MGFFCYITIESKNKNMNTNDFIKKTLNNKKLTISNIVHYMLYGFFCFIIGFMLMGAIMNNKYEIKDKPKSKSFTGVKQRIEHTAYITSVYYKNQRIHNNMDFINNYEWNDTMICYRYDEGIKLIKQYQHIDSISCN